MRLFGRKNNVETVPQEVREYYEAERRERTGLAWLLALGTLVVTLLIASGLFFGGRWAYHKVADKNDKKTVATQTQGSEPKFESTTEDSKTEQKATTAAPSTSTSSTATSTPAATPAPSATKTTPAPAVTTPAPAATSTTTTPKTLVNTGPADIIVIFVTIAAAGTLYHRFVLSRL